MDHLTIPALAALYLIASLVSFAQYAYDKFAAKRPPHRQARRIPEKQLLLIDALGGWPGALLAQRTFRHKTRKPSYRIKFITAIITNIAALALIARTAL